VRVRDISFQGSGRISKAADVVVEGRRLREKPESEVKALVVEKVLT